MHWIPDHKFINITWAISPFRNIHFRLSIFFSFYFFQLPTPQFLPPSPPRPYQKSIRISIMSLLSDQEGFAIAVEEAKIGYEEGGVPV